jgi:hypothetical protein
MNGVHVTHIRNGKEETTEQVTVTTVELNSSKTAAVLDPSRTTIKTTSSMVSFETVYEATLDESMTDGMSFTSGSNNCDDITTTATTPKNNKNNNNNGNGYVGLNRLSRAVYLYNDNDSNESKWFHALKDILRPIRKMEFRNVLIAQVRFLITSRRIYVVS